MDYEKAYNESLDRARQFMSEHPTRAEADLMIALFPELAESEDEKIRKGMITYLKNMKYNAELSGGDTSICDKWINYLERQSVWESPIMTLEMMMGKQKEQSLRDFIDDFPYSATQKEQKPVEWSEEDGAKLGALINYFEGDALDYSTDDIVDWLKSLCPQPHWKPSEEQMDALRSKLPIIIGTGNYVDSLLESLYNDLKKLM